MKNSKLIKVGIMSGFAYYKLAVAIVGIMIFNSINTVAQSQKCYKTEWSCPKDANNGRDTDWEQCTSHIHEVRCPKEPKEPIVKEPKETREPVVREPKEPIVREPKEPVEHGRKD